MNGDEIAVALDTAGDQALHAPAVGPRVFGPAASWREAFDRRTVAVDGGHLHWAGATTGTSGTPVVAWQNKVETAGRLAFRWHYGREPEGNVRSRCGYLGCVAGAHLTDRRLREGGTA